MLNCDHLPLIVLAESNFWFRFRFFIHRFQWYKLRWKGRSARTITGTIWFSYLCSLCRAMRFFYLCSLCMAMRFSYLYSVCRDCDILLPLFSSAGLWDSLTSVLSVGQWDSLTFVLSAGLWDSLTFVLSAGLWDSPCVLLPLLSAGLWDSLTFVLSAGLWDSLTFVLFCRAMRFSYLCSLCRAMRFSYLCSLCRAMRFSLCSLTFVLSAGLWDSPCVVLPLCLSAGPWDSLTLCSLFHVSMLFLHGVLCPLCRQSPWFSYREGWHCASCVCMSSLLASRSPSACHLPLLSTFVRVIHGYEIAPKNRKSVTLKICSTIDAQTTEIHVTSPSNLHCSNRMGSESLCLSNSPSLISRAMIKIWLVFGACKRVQFFHAMFESTGPPAYNTVPLSCRQGWHCKSASEWIRTNSA